MHVLSHTCFSPVDLSCVSLVIRPAADLGGKEGGLFLCPWSSWRCQVGTGGVRRGGGVGVVPVFLCTDGGRVHRTGRHSLLGEQVSTSQRRDLRTEPEGARIYRLGGGAGEGVRRSDLRGEGHSRDPAVRRASWGRWGFLGTMGTQPAWRVPRGSQEMRESRRCG